MDWGPLGDVGGGGDGFIEGAGLAFGWAAARSRSEAVEKRDRKGRRRSERMGCGRSRGRRLLEWKKRPLGRPLERLAMATEGRLGRYVLQRQLVLGIRSRLMEVRGSLCHERAAMGAGAGAGGDAGRGA